MGTLSVVTQTVDPFESNKEPITTGAVSDITFTATATGFGNSCSISSTTTDLSKFIQFGQILVAGSTNNNGLWTIREVVDANNLLILETTLVSEAPQAGVTISSHYNILEVKAHEAPTQDVNIPNGLIDRNFSAPATTYDMKPYFSRDITEWSVQNAPAGINITADGILIHDATDVSNQTWTGVTITATNDYGSVVSNEFEISGTV